MCRETKKGGIHETSTEVRYPRPVEIMTLHVCPDILNIPVIPDIPEIPTISEISIIIQISSRLWFQKGMTLYVCSGIPEILNIPDIPDIPEIPIIPKIPIIIQITSILRLQSRNGCRSFWISQILAFEDPNYEPGRRQRQERACQQHLYLKLNHTFTPCIGPRLFWTLLIRTIYWIKCV